LSAFMWSRITLFSLAAIAAGLLTACASEAWVTPLAPAREARAADCPVILTSDGPKPGTQNLGIVRCEYRWSDCEPLIREKACGVGGDIVYGMHYEHEYRRHVLVGTIGVAAPGTTPPAAFP
jgi:hypothetical protein